MRGGRLREVSQILTDGGTNRDFGWSLNIKKEITEATRNSNFGLYRVSGAIPRRTLLRRVMKIARLYE